MTEKKRRAKPKVARTEVFALRMDPRLKYLAEIASRKQRRSLASFVEWSIEQALSKVYLVDVGVTHPDSETVLQAANNLWALDECARVQRLVAEFPELLTYEEQLIWRVVTDHSVFHDGDVSKFVADGEVYTHLVCGCWDQIKAFALGAGTVEELNEALIAADHISF